MPSHRIEIDDPSLGTRVGRQIRDARHLVGWTQADLAARAGTTQSTISRIELGHAPELDLGVVARSLAALGYRGAFELDAPHLADRARQRDPVHARIVGMIARRLARLGWLVATEAPFGGPVPRGWIDVLGFRPSDAAGLVVEVKGDVPDAGALQRQTSLYARAAHQAAAEQGWRPEGVAVLVAVLDSGAMAARLGANRDLLGRAYPGSPGAFGAWLRDGGDAPRPTIAAVNPASRAADWLLRTSLSGRRSTPAYRDYADAAAVLRVRR